MKKIKIEGLVKGTIKIFIFWLKRELTSKWQTSLFQKNYTTENNYKDKYIFLNCLKEWRCYQIRGDLHDNILERRAALRNVLQI